MFILTMKLNFYPLDIFCKKHLSLLVTFWWLGFQIDISSISTCTWSEMVRWGFFFSCEKSETLSVWKRAAWNYGMLKWQWITLSWMSQKIEILYVVQSSAHSWNQKKDSLEYQGLYVMTLIASWVEIKTIKVGSFFI